MLHKLTQIALAALLLIVGYGCKRETFEKPVNGGAMNNPVAQQVQQWLKTQPSVSNISGRQAGAALPPHVLQWAGAKVNANNNVLAVPANWANTKMPNAYARLYLLANLSGEGGVISGQYVVVLPSTVAMKQATAKEDAAALLLQLQMGNAPEGFSGAVLYYDMAGKLTNNKVYEAGTLRQDATATLAARGDGESSPSPKYVLQNCESRNCIDWYWQTYVDGVLTFEEYITTTCGCVAEGAGGGGGGNGTTTTGGGDEESACVATCGNVNTLINNMSGMKLNEYSITSGNIIGPSANGSIRQPKTIRIDFYKLDFGLGFYARFAAIYTGVVYKINKDDPNWKWESLQFVKTAHTEGTIPPCAEAQSNATPAPMVFSADRRFAQIAFDFNVKADFVCPIKLPIFNYNSSQPAWGYDANWD